MIYVSIWHFLICFQARGAPSDHQASFLLLLRPSPEKKQKRGKTIKQLDDGNFWEEQRTRNCKGLMMNGTYVWEPSLLEEDCTRVYAHPHIFAVGAVAWALINLADIQETLTLCIMWYRLPTTFHDEHCRVELSDAEDKYSLLVVKGA